MSKGAPLTPDELELWRTLEALAGPDEMLDFIPLVSPRFSAPRHLRRLAEVFWRVEHEGEVRALVSVPPRHGKTETILHFGIARFLMLHPEKTVGYITYAADVARSKSKHARDLAQKAGVVLRRDISAAHEWRTPQGGGLLATGIGGPLTGHGLDLLIVDDPFKNREEAESPTIRAKVHDWLTSTAFSRLEPRSSVVVNMARWHDDDVIGRLEKDEETRWEVVNFPAVADDDEPDRVEPDPLSGEGRVVVGRKKGEALWPERWGEEELDARRRLVGSYDWASLYQGSPRPKGGRLFREPARYRFPDLDGARIGIACDPAASEKTSADFSAIVVAAAKGSGVSQVVDVLEVFRAQIDQTKLVARLVETQRAWGAPIHIEAVGGFKGIPSAMRAIDPNLRIVEVTPQGDKFTRALPAAAAWNDNRVRVPMDAPWVRDFLAEVCAFTGVKDTKDDQVDALAHVFAAIDRRSEANTRGATKVRGA